MKKKIYAILSGVSMLTSTGVMADGLGVLSQDDLDRVTAGCLSCTSTTTFNKAINETFNINKNISVNENVYVNKNFISNANVNGFVAHTLLNEASCSNATSCLAETTTITAVDPWTGKAFSANESLSVAPKSW